MSVSRRVSNQFNYPTEYHVRRLDPTFVIPGPADLQHPDSHVTHVISPPWPFYNLFFQFLSSAGHR